MPRALQPIRKAAVAEEPTTARQRYTAIFAAAAVRGLATRRAKTLRRWQHCQLHGRLAGQKLDRSEAQHVQNARAEARKVKLPKRYWKEDSCRSQRGGRAKATAARKMTA